MTTSSPPAPLPHSDLGFLFQPGDRNPEGRHSPSRRGIYLAPSESRRSASDDEVQVGEPATVADFAPLSTATKQPT